MSTQWFYWWAGLGPITFLLVRDRALEEISGLKSAGSPWFTPTLEISTVFLDLSFLKAKFSCWPAYYRKQYLWETSASHLQVKFVIFYISVEAIDCFHVFWSQFKVKHLEGRNNHITSPSRNQSLPGDWRSFQLNGDKKGGQGSRVCPQLSGEQAWEPLLNSHLCFPHLLLLCPPHKHYSTSVPYLSKWVTSDRKQTKIILFQSHHLQVLLTR